MELTKQSQGGCLLSATYMLCDRRCLTSSMIRAELQFLGQSLGVGEDAMLQPMTSHVSRIAVDEHCQIGLSIVLLAWATKRRIDLCWRGEPGQ